MRPKLTLAGQQLVLQLGIVSVVLVGVAAVSLAQSNARFGETEGRRALAVAETVAATGTLRDVLDNRNAVTRGEAEPSPALDRTVLVRTVAESARSVSGSASVVIADAEGMVVASPDPKQLAARLELPNSPLVSGRAWTGEVEQDGRPGIVAQVPVLSDAPQRIGQVIGVVAVTRERPSLLENLASAAPNLLTYLSIATALGVVGSFLVARWVKRQTLGLEPREITSLVEHRDALLHGIKEGVVALDRQNRVTLANDVAVELLRLPPDTVGRSIGDLGLNGAMVDVLGGRVSGTDLAVPIGDRVLILNRMPITSRGRPLGSVTTLRDRTELITLQRELDAVQQVTETLRAQAHEFSNRLHTLSGLIELGEYDEVVRHVQRISARHGELSHQVISRIADPSVAALLVAKGSLAEEQATELRIAPTCRLGRLEEPLSADVVTVVGNLVDNALDAVRPLRHRGWVEVEVRGDEAEVIVTVRDCGPGISAEHATDVFRRGFSTKTSGAGQRGIGLALVRLICDRRGGEVRVDNDGGAVFIARLPVGAELVA